MQPRPESLCLYAQGILLPGLWVPGTNSFCLHDVSILWPFASDVNQTDRPAGISHCMPFSAYKCGPVLKICHHFNGHSARNSPSDFEEHRPYAHWHQVGQRDAGQPQNAAFQSKTHWLWPGQDRLIHTKGGNHSAPLLQVRSDEHLKSHKSTNERVSEIAVLLIVFAGLQRSFWVFLWPRP